MVNISSVIPRRAISKKNVSGQAGVTDFEFAFCYSPKKIVNTSNRKNTVNEIKNEHKDLQNLKF